MKKVLIALYLILTISGAVKSEEVRFDTLFTTQVGPGVYHQKIVAPDVPWELDVLAIDLRNPYINMETVKSQNKIEAYERTSKMSARMDKPGHRSVGAVNGDFYATGGIPINAQVINGRLLHSVAYNYKSTIGFDFDNNPFINVTQFSGELITKSANRHINAVNRIRDNNFLVLYNSYFGSSTTANNWGTEIELIPIDPWIVNDTVRCVVGVVEKGVGDMTIPADRVVMSGHGTAETFLNANISENDTLEIVLSLQPLGDRITQLLGGFPRIIKDGIDYVSIGYPQEGGSSNFHTARHPRTAAGFSADSSMLYLVTVDGRQDHSIGMNLYELVEFMLRYDIAQAINLDGGGSTTMVVRNVVKNSPSDGNERSVANVLLVTSSAPNSELAHVQIQPDQFVLYPNEKIKFNTTGWDSSYNPVQISSSLIEFNVDSSLGTVDQSGLFTATKNGAQGFVYTYYNGLKDSAYIKSKAITEIALDPQVAVTDTSKEFVFRVNSEDEDGKQHTLDNSSYAWKLLNDNVGHITQSGVFTGKNEGITQVVILYTGLTDTAEVRVEVGRGESVIDSMDSSINWNLKGELIDTTHSSLVETEMPKTFGRGSFQVNYQYEKTGDNTWLFLNTDIPIYGVPEKIKCDFKSDGQRHKIYMVVSNNAGDLFRASPRSFAIDSSFKTYEVLTSNFKPITKGNFNFPINLRSIQILLGSDQNVGQTASGTVYVDHLRLVYPQVTGISDNHIRSLVNDFALYQNYPNPFNSNTRITFHLYKTTLVSLRIFDIRGREITNLLEKKMPAGKHNITFDNSTLASGIYFYNLKAGAKSQSRKMICLK